MPLSTKPKSHPEAQAQPVAPTTVEMPTPQEENKRRQVAFAFPEMSSRAKEPKKATLLKRERDPRPLKKPRLEGSAWRPDDPTDENQPPGRHPPGNQLPRETVSQTSRPHCTSSNQIKLESESDSPTGKDQKSEVTAPKSEIAVPGASPLTQHKMSESSSSDEINVLLGLFSRQRDTKQRLAEQQSKIRELTLELEDSRIARVSLENLLAKAQSTLERFHARLGYWKNGPSTSNGSDAQQQVRKSDLLLLRDNERQRHAEQEQALATEHAHEQSRIQTAHKTAMVNKDKAYRALKERMQAEIEDLIRLVHKNESKELDQARDIEMQLRKEKRDLEDSYQLEMIRVMTIAGVKAEELENTLMKQLELTPGI
jgi:hypothetical protein